MIKIFAIIIALLFLILGCDNQTQTNQIPTSPKRRDASHLKSVESYNAYFEELERVERCFDNLLEIRKAASAYRSDHGQRPTAAEQLIPDYLPVMPTCPAAGRDTYSTEFSNHYNDAEMARDVRRERYLRDGDSLRGSRPIYVPRYSLR